MEQEEVVIAAVVVVAEEVQVRDRVAMVRRTSIPSTRHPDMLTCPHLKPVSGTGPMGSQHIFVWNLEPAPGNSFGCQNQTLNEIQTGSTIRKTVSLFMNFYTRQNSHK